MECKCGSQDMEFKKGVSKKTGKPYAGYRCNDCGDMVFVKTQGNGGRNYPTPPPQTGQQIQQPTNDLALILQEIKRSNQLLAKLVGAKNVAEGNLSNIEPEELEPDESVPF